MRYCNTCHIYFEPPMQRCMFCNNELHQLQSQTRTANDWNYPPYRRQHTNRKLFIKLFTFIVFVTNAICICIDYKTSHHSLHWSLYVLATTLYALILSCFITKRSRLIKKLTQIVLTTDLYLLLLSILIGSYHWCSDYVLPFSIMALNLYAMIPLFVNQQRMYDYGIYVLNLSLLGCLFLFFLPTSWIIVTWPTIACILYSICTLFALFLFSPSMTWDELRRRLHF